jgi:hypothetical protein
MKATKAQLIEAIQVAEAKAWKKLSEDKKHFGEDDNITRGTRREWGALFELRQSLDIPAMSLFKMIHLNLVPTHKEK